MAEIFRPPYFQVESAAGVPLSGAKLYFYVAGTTTDQAVYQEIGLSTQHTQPVVADASGIFPAIYLGASTYKAVLKTAADVEIKSYDNINATSAGSTVLDGTFRIQNTSDNTKQVAISAAGVTTGTTRTLTAPNASGTIALTSDLSNTTYAATTSAAGIVELATQTEAATISDTSRAITPDGLFFLSGYTTTVTAAGTTTLTVTSTYNQYFTGSTTQTVALPVTSTLALGRPFRIVNNSTGALTINSSGGNLVATVAAGQTSVVTCILTSGTTAASWSAVTSAASSAGLVLLTSGTVSAAATLDIVLTSYTGYRGIRVVLTNFVPVTDATDLWLRASTDGGGTFDAGASDYKYSTATQNSGSTTYSATASNGAAQMVTIRSFGNNAADGGSMVLDFFGQTSTASKQRFQWQGTSGTTGGTENAFSNVGVGKRNAAQDTDAIRFLFSSGNIASGEYAVYGYV